MGGILEEHGDALYDFALSVTGDAERAVAAVREAVPAAVSSLRARRAPAAAPTSSTTAPSTGIRQRSRANPRFFSPRSSVGRSTTIAAPAGTEAAEFVTS